MNGMTHVFSIYIHISLQHKKEDFIQIEMRRFLILNTVICRNKCSYYENNPMVELKIYFKLNINYL